MKHHSHNMQRHTLDPQLYPVTFLRNYAGFTETASAIAVFSSINAYGSCLETTMFPYLPLAPIAAHVSPCMPDKCRMRMALSAIIYGLFSSPSAMQGLPSSGLHTLHDQVTPLQEQEFARQDM
jgi:hypothetical protein